MPKAEFAHILFGNGKETGKDGNIANALNY